MTVTAYRGPVALRAVGGDVRARTTNGPLDIELTGARWDGAGLDAETTNGPVDLTIPEGYSAQLEFGTVNGPMTVEFPLTVDRKSTRLNSSHSQISYAVFCLKKKKKHIANI